jgi:hypothetical protein
LCILEIMVLYHWIGVYDDGFYHKGMSIKEVYRMFQEYRDSQFSVHNVDPPCLCGTLLGHGQPQSDLVDFYECTGRVAALFAQYAEMVKPLGSFQYKVRVEINPSPFLPRCQLPVMAYNDNHVVVFRFQPEVSQLNIYDLIYTEALHAVLVVGDNKSEEKPSDKKPEEKTRDPVEQKRYGGKKIWVCIVTLMKDVAPLLLDLSIFSTKGVTAFTGAVVEQTTQFHHKWFSYTSHIGRQCPPRGLYADLISTALDNASTKKDALYGAYVKSWMDNLVRKERKKADKVKKVLTDMGLFLADLGEVAMVAWERDARKLEAKPVFVATENRGYDTVGFQ